MEIGSFVFAWYDTLRRPNCGLSVFSDQRFLRAATSTRPASPLLATAISTSYITAGPASTPVDTGVFGALFEERRDQMVPAKLLASDPFRSVGNGVIWQAPDGLVWLFYVVRYGSTGSTSRIQGKISRDNGETSRPIAS